ncbi:hypothetical protein Nepgr_000094 [Nepenthes gracilis]|uniref:RING-type E3 ubiquitin transferase n=1 Tax=Nepenthes gracilis TaxID=150966 RepID=A0AAD3P3Z2_NEPGR|nr:hypothetical protein Nepgr_000094 [Nepenthes gracilis]
MLSKVLLHSVRYGFFANGKYEWTREAIVGIRFDPIDCQADILTAESLRSKPLQCNKSEPLSSEVGSSSGASHQQGRKLKRLEYQSAGTGAAIARNAEVTPELQKTKRNLTAIWQEKVEAEDWLERWRSHQQAGGANINANIELLDNVPQLVEFSQFNIQTATCNFSEGLKLGEGGCGSVYMGELMDRTVAIKKLYPHSMQGPSQFQKEVQVLGKPRHLHLDIICCPSFSRYAERQGASPYTDPEFHRTGVLSSKSDVNSFGLVIPQLLTGRPPMRLAAEVRKAVFCGELALILDPSAGHWPISLAGELADWGFQLCQLNSRSQSELTPTVIRALQQLHTSEEGPVLYFFFALSVRYATLTLNLKSGVFLC